MCDSKWSNRDTFDLYNDCHIYLPINIFLSVLIFIGSFVCLCFGLQKTIYEKRKSIPLATFGLGIFLSLTYGISMGTKMTFADRNIGLNLIYAFARSCMWINVNLTSFRQLEVIVSIDERTIASSQTVHRLFMKFNILATCLSIITELITVLLPTIMSKLNFFSFIGAAYIIILLMNCGPQIGYAWELLQIILGAQSVSRDSTFYNKIRQNLQRFLRSIIIATIVGTTLTLCMLFIPIFRSNLYVPYNIQLLLCPIGVFSNCYTTTRHGTDTNEKKPPSNTSNTTQNPELKSKNTESVNRSTRGDSQPQQPSVGGPYPQGRPSRSASGVDLPFIDQPTTPREGPATLPFSSTALLTPSTGDNRQPQEQPQGGEESSLLTPKKIWNPYEFTDSGEGHLVNPSPSTNSLPDNSNRSIEPPTPTVTNELSTIEDE